MVDTSKIGNLPVPTHHNQKATFAATKDVKSRTTLIDYKESAHEKRAIKKLDHLLASDVPPRTDVQRGYYLDILI
ncbi:MAG: hypothetical protein OQJ97_08995 [Rhodospirillales bacterium]|nr:hypothetical protein [Rhodospirillales bacterium]